MSLKRYFNTLPYLILISAFGVYVVPGVRMEHLIIYPSVALFIIYALLTMKKMITNYFFIFLIWVVFLAITLTVTRFNNGESFNILGDVESFITPMLLMILFLFISGNQNKVTVEETLIKSSKTLIVMLVFNTIFIIYSMFNDVTQLGAMFWGGESTVAHAAMTNGRYSGVFNQPMEAGVAYSIGLLAWLYLSEKINTSTFKYTLSLFLMVIGGLVTVSKVFIFGGLGLFFLGALINKSLRKRIIKLMIRTLIIAVPGFFLVFRTWSGLEYLLRFTTPTEGFLTMVTAGRFGEESQQASLFSEVWSENPIFGRGFGVTEIYDSEFFRFFAIGGTTGLILYGIIIVILIYAGIKSIKINRFKEESKLFILLIVLIIGTGIGAPTLTLNRSSVILWVFIGLLFQYFYYQKTEVKQKKEIDLSQMVINDTLNQTVR